MSSQMDAPDIPNKQRQDFEVWREAWEEQWADLPPESRPALPDPGLFDIAAHAREVIDLLEEHGIPCCVVGIKALCYYGAPRLCSVCSPPDLATVSS